MQALVAQRGKWIAAAALVAAVVLPLVLPSFYVHIMVLMVIFAIFAMSLDILMGYAGLPSSATRRSMASPPMPRAC